MRIITLLSSFLQGKPFTSKEIGSVGAEVSFSAAIKAHLAWKSRLLESITSKTSDSLSLEDNCRDDRCELGKWLHGMGQQRYGNLKAFKELVANHANFHTIACQVIKLAREGQHERAQQLLQTDLQATSTEIVGRLKKFVKVFEPGQ